METVEYLMIGEDADTKIIVSKAFMKGLFDRGEDVPFGVSPCLEDFLQAIILFLTVSKDIDLITLQLIVFECLGKQVEVLMEQGLRGNMETKRRVLSAT